MSADVMPAPASAAAAGCFHCGLPLPAGSSWSVEIGGTMQSMCCPGCEAVARTIIDNGLEEYYRDRQAFSPSANGAAPLPDELRRYDTPEASTQFASLSTDDNGGILEALLCIEGVRCAACVWLIERQLAQLPGVLSARLNVATEKLLVRWKEATSRPSDILLSLQQIGYVAYPYDAQRYAEQLRRSARTLGRQLFIAALSMMQVMMYAVPAYIADDATMDADMASLMRWASLLLTLPAVCYSAYPFFHGAWQSIRRGVAGMDVPVTVGIGAAFAASSWATWTGQGDVYFDSVTMFIFLLLCSRYLELLARRNAASAMDTLQHALPASALLVPGYPGLCDAESVPATRLKAGDIVLIKPGDAVPVDCCIVDGSTMVDLALLTGESQPVQKSIGDTLDGGAINAGQAVVARVLRPFDDSTLSVLIRLVERAGQAKPQLACWADRVAAWFVVLLLLFSVAVFSAWQWIDPARAWPVAIAVLVVSCPCALSLATPTALAAATSRLVARGVLVVRSHVLETLHQTTHVVFDKTGTLTEGRPQLRDVKTFGNVDRSSCLRIAAALEATSAHPLAAAIIAAAHETRADFSHGDAQCAVEVVDTTGKGIEGRIGGTCHRLGSRTFAGELAGKLPDVDGGAGVAGLTSIYLATEGACLARFDLADSLRQDVREVVGRLQSEGKVVILLSGDHEEVTQRVAAEAGIGIAAGGRLPKDKLDYVRQLQQDGAIVAMVGDGINDAAVLRAADVSFAMGTGAGLALAHADTVLLSGNLSSLSEAADTAAQTIGVIRQNLAWATAYNLVAIPAAAFGWISPWMSAIGMSLSSAIVVLNALRLTRDRRRHRRSGSPQPIGAALSTALAV